MQAGRKTKKLINTAFIYAICAMIGGVFYREFTKFNGFEGQTTLAVVHTHLFMMGMMFFLIAALCENCFLFSAHKRFRTFFLTYNIGLILTVIMLTVRGITQVLTIELSKGASASISGISGIGHILLSAGVILFFLMIKKGCFET